MIHKGKPHGCLGKRLLGRGGIKGKVPRQVWGPLSSRKSKNAKAELSMEGEHRSTAGGEPEQACLWTRAKTLGYFLG